MTSSKQAKREAKQLFRLCFVNGRLDESRARLVADLMGTADRRGARMMLKHFLRLAALDRAAHTANIESATALSPELRREIAARLAARFGGALSTSFVLRPELIGGMRIQVGSNLYDGSVRTGFEMLERSFSAR